jgi:hypothetical protein
LLFRRLCSLCLLQQRHPVELEPPAALLPAVKAVSLPN